MILPDLHPVLAGVHVAEVAEALPVEVGEALVLHGVGVPVPDLRPEGVEDDVRGADEGFHLLLPFIRVSHKLLVGDGSQIPVSPAVAGQLPSVVPQALGQLADRLPILLDVGVDALVGGVGAVAHDAVVAGEGDDGAGSPVGEIRVLLDEILQQGNQVVGAGDGGAVLQVHLAGGLSVLPDDQAAGEAVPLHVLVVAHVVLGHDEGLLSLRQHDIPRHKGDVSVLIGYLPGHIVDAHQDIAPVVHGLKNFQEFIPGGHHLIVAVLHGVAVKGLGGVHDQRVEEHMGDFRRVGPDQGGFCGLILADGLGHLRLAGVLAVVEKVDGGVVVVPHGQAVRLGDEGLCTGENLWNLRRRALRLPQNLGLSGGRRGDIVIVKIPNQVNAAADDENREEDNGKKRKIAADSAHFPAVKSLSVFLFAHTISIKILMASV